MIYLNFKVIDICDDGGAVLPVLDVHVDDDSSDGEGSDEAHEPNESKHQILFVNQISQSMNRGIPN